MIVGAREIERNSSAVVQKITEIPGFNICFITGVLKTPVRLTCGKDPCVGKLCPVDAEARCFTDYECKSTFWNLNTKEEVNVCKGSVGWLNLSLPEITSVLLVSFMRVPISLINTGSSLIRIKK